MEKKFSEAFEQLLLEIDIEIENYQRQIIGISKGVKVAGQRARKASLKLDKLFKDFRKLSIRELNNV